MQGSFAPVCLLFSPFDGSKILLPFAKKTFGFYKLFKVVDKSLTRNITFFKFLKLLLNLQKKPLIILKIFIN